MQLKALAKLLKPSKGRLTLKIKAAKAGKLKVTWTIKVGHKTVTVATGSVTFPKAGTRTLTMKISATGDHCVRKHHKVKLAAKASFTPKGGKAQPLGASFSFTRA